VLLRLKEELLVATGEDTTDIFAAFEHYGLAFNPIQ
jgi:hypothetical protein